MSGHRTIDRVSADDLMSLVGDSVFNPMQTGAVLFLDTDAGFDLDRALAAFGARVATVPRLHQLLVDVPFGCGRPIWIDDPDFVSADQVSIVECPFPDDEEAVLKIAAYAVNTPLLRSRPLWSATVLTSASLESLGRPIALVFVFHHVMADGIGGLSLLADLADGAALRPEATRPEYSAAGDSPTRKALFFDACSERLRSIPRIRGAVLRFVDGVAEVRSAGRVHPVHSSLNVPTGAGRLLETVSSELRGIRESSHATGATVNDAVLAAVAGSLHRLMELRGERLDEVVISVPFSSRRSAVSTELGNRSGVIPLRVPAAGVRLDRLDAVAAISRAAKLTRRAASTAVLRPIFRGLARIGAYRWFIGRQRMIHTIVSTVHGPEAPISLLGCEVTRVAPLGIPTGNLPVTFAVITYAGMLTITLVSDPDACPDVRILRTLLTEELRAYSTLRHS